MAPCTIAIAGPSGSGKSLFAQTLCDDERLVNANINVVLMKEDAYYRDQGHLSLADREHVNYDHPDAIEHELLAAQLRSLRQGDSVEAPLYDFSVHTRREETQALTPAPVIIVEGILLLSDATLRECFDIKLYIDTPLDICLLRRIDRDLRERGRTLESVITQYQSTVRPMYQQYILPSAEHADMVITRGGRNRVALDIVRDMILARPEASPAESAG